MKSIAIVLGAAASLAAFAVEAGTRSFVEMSGCETGKFVALPDKAFADNQISCNPPCAARVNLLSYPHAPHRVNLPSR